MVLSPRLKKIVFHVPRVQLVADIGTDHAKVPIGIIREDKATRCIGVDRSAQTLVNARMHVKSSGYQSRIELRAGDGLTVLRPGEVDCVVISGLGGNLMIKMLEANRPAWVRARLILQPNRDIGLVRRWLYEEGVGLSTESILRDRGHYYTILVGQLGDTTLRDAAYRIPQVSLDDLHILGPHLLREDAPVYRQWLDHQVIKLEKTLEKIPEGDERQAEIAAELKVYQRAQSWLGI